MFIRPSVRMEQLGTHWTDFHEILYLSITRKSVEKIQVSLKSDKNTQTALYMKTDIHFPSYLTQFFLERKIFQEKKVSEKLRNTHFMSNNSPHPPENRGVYEIMSKNNVEPDRPQMTIWRIACWISKATSIRTVCVTLVSFRLQQWLYERASVLRYTYIACLFHM